MTLQSEGYRSQIEQYVSLHDVPAARKHFFLICGFLLILSDLLPNVGVDPDPWSLGIELVMGLGVIALAFADRLDARKRVAWSHRGVACLMGFVLAGTTAEGSARWVFRDVTTSADNGGFFSRRWVPENVLLNEHGYRERAFPAVKPAGTYRIAAIGDSFTFGNGLLPRQRYSDLLNQWLPEEFEVLNFGVPGDNTPQHLERLRDVIAAHPDFVLLQWFVNDIEGSDLSGRPRTWPLVAFQPIHRWLGSHSAFYTVANMRWAETQIALGWAPSYEDYLKARALDPNSGDARRDAAQLHQIIDRSRREGIAIGIVLFPDAGPDLGAAYPFAFLHEHVLAVCRAAQIPCLDLRETFAGVKDRRTLWVSPFDHHPSARANEMAALKILEIFERHWVR